VVYDYLNLSDVVLLGYNKYNLADTLKKSLNANKKTNRISPLSLLSLHLVVQQVVYYFTYKNLFKSCKTNPGIIDLHDSGKTAQQLACRALRFLHENRGF
jgi:hypothetical protein